MLVVISVVIAVVIAVDAVMFLWACSGIGGIDTGNG